MRKKGISLGLAGILFLSGCSMFRKNEETSDPRIRYGVKEELEEIDQGTIDIEEYKEKQERVVDSINYNKFLQEVKGKITYRLEEPLEIRAKDCEGIRQYFFAVDDRMQTIIYAPEDRIRFQNLYNFLEYADKKDMEIQIKSIPLEDNSFRDIYFPSLSHVAETNMFGNEISYIHDDDTNDHIAHNRRKRRMEAAKKGYEWFKKASEFVPGY